MQRRHFLESGFGALSLFMASSVLPTQNKIAKAMVEPQKSTNTDLAENQAEAEALKQPKPKHSQKPNKKHSAKKEVKPSKPQKAVASKTKQSDTTES